MRSAFQDGSKPREARSSEGDGSWCSISRELLLQRNTRTEGLCKRSGARSLLAAAASQ
jgi:hypothetical protein